MAVLAQIARYAPDKFEENSDVVLEFILQNLLTVPIPRSTPGDGQEEEDEEEWADDQDVSDLLHAKVIALKLCRYRSLVHSDDKSMTVAKPVFKLLASILDHSGALVQDVEEECVESLPCFSLALTP